MKKFNFNDHFNYLKENLIIMFKVFIEFKSNSYSSLLFEIIYSVIEIFFLIIIQKNFGDLIGWNLADFLMFYLLINIIGNLSMLFHSKELFYLIKNGDLNLYISKPLNIFFKTVTTNLFSGNIIFILSSFIQGSIIIYLFYDNYTFSFLFFLFLFLVIILDFLLLYLFESLDFIKLGLSKISKPYYNLRWSILTNYPFELFNKFKYKFFLFSFGFTFVGSLLVPLVTNKEIINFKLQISILISLIIIFFVIINLLWKYGLKKYEAFG